ncbi:MAG TPA: hypothetical protein VMX13_16945 [Sedimentisphaerales bacterium]|nr:hypothetical protein [Sedimentisphaerales bacterium]
MGRTRNAIEVGARGVGGWRLSMTAAVVMIGIIMIIEGSMRAP